MYSAADKTNTNRLPSGKEEIQTEPTGFDLESLSDAVRGKAVETQDVSLVVVAGPDLGKRVQLDASQCIVGRDPSCQLVLVDETISRFHASFRQYPELPIFSPSVVMSSNIKSKLIHIPSHSMA